jgi:hypothetical protein
MSVLPIAGVATGADGERRRDTRADVRAAAASVTRLQWRTPCCGSVKDAAAICSTRWSNGRVCYPMRVRGKSEASDKTERTRPQEDPRLSRTVVPFRWFPCTGIVGSATHQLEILHCLLLDLVPYGIQSVSTIKKPEI